LETKGSGANRRENETAKSFNDLVKELQPDQKVEKKEKKEGLKGNADENMDIADPFQDLRRVRPFSGGIY